MEVFRPGRERSLPRRVLLPRRWRVIVRDLLHRYAPLHRAHVRTEVAPDARLLDDLHDLAVAALIPADSLMRAVLARRPAQLTFDTLVVVDAGDEVVVGVNSPLELVALTGASEYVH